MDKSVALERLNSLENEARELRKIIEDTSGLRFDGSNMYVALIGGRPYILAGSGADYYYRWHSFASYPTVQGWAANHKTGQTALDFIKEYEVHEFTDEKQGMKFFYKHYMGET